MCGVICMTASVVFGPDRQYPSAVWKNRLETSKQACSRLIRKKRISDIEVEMK